MTREELKKGATVVHTRYNRLYTIDEPNARLKDSEKGWIDCVIYRPLYDNPIDAFAREKESFLTEFELKK